MMKKLTALFLVILALDQYTKFLIRDELHLYDSIPVIDGFFNITYVLNPGAAFGFLANLNESYRQLFFIIVTILAIAAVTYLLYQERTYKMRSFGYTLVLSGAVGNFIDRIYIGKVVDFLDVYVGQYHWPAFNIADSAITVGITIIFIDYIFLKRGTNENQTEKRTD